MLSKKPAPKSKILGSDLEINGDIQNQLHIVMSFGSVNAGSVKYWLLAATVLALPVKNALYELAHGPDACEVGEDAEAVRAPVIPVTSARKASGLKG